MTEISDEDIDLIMQARKTLLFNEGIPWVKKRGDEDSGVLMSCFDGVEVCESARSHILRQLSQLCEHRSVGLYRDDSLAIMKGLLGPEPESVKKKS